MRIEAQGASDEELAAIMAAYEALWPRPQAPKPDRAVPAWRFSGRWWIDSPRPVRPVPR